MTFGLVLDPSWKLQWFRVRKPDSIDSIRDMLLEAVSFSIFLSRA